MGSPLPTKQMTDASSSRPSPVPQRAEPRQKQKDAELCGESHGIESGMGRNGLQPQT